jgi:ubiquinone/menaquinone biosynthesis C-methylase UbiE
VTQTEPSTFDRIAAPYDRGMAPLEKLWLQEMRNQLLPHARGRVLEIGVGTGANLPFYPPSVCVTAVDESTDMLAVATHRASALNRRVHFCQTDVECYVVSSTSAVPWASYGACSTSQGGSSSSSNTCVPMSSH